MTEVIFNESTTNSYIPQITADKAGNVHLVWYESTNYSDAGTDEDIFYRIWNITTGCWMEIEVVSFEFNGSSNVPVIAVDNNGDAHVAWRDTTDYNGAGGDDDIFYKIRNATTGNWTPTVVLSNSSENSRRPAITVDSSGNAHVVWSNYNGSGSDWDIFYRCWNATTDNWTISQVLSVDSTSNSGSPSIAVDANGTIHVIWAENSGGQYIVLYTFWNITANTWSGAEHISTESTDDILGPEIAVDGAGHVHLIWDEWSAYNGSGLQFDIFYKWRNSTIGNWTITEVVSTESSAPATQPSIATDCNGNAHVVWWDTTNLNGAGSDSDIFYKYRNATTGVWTPVDVVSTESTGDSEKPTIAVDEDGYVHIAWEDATDYNGAGTDFDIFYKRTVLDGINPGACELNVSCPFPPNFVLEDTLFEIWGGNDVGGAGISHYQYKVDTGEWLTASSFSLAGISDGPHVIFYRAVDAVGNNGTAQNVTVYLLANDTDYDNDGLTNAAEIYEHGTDAFNPDTDGDGLADGLEVGTYGTNPTTRDTDGDGLSDSEEISKGSDPLDPNDPLIGRLLLILELVCGIIVTGVIIRIVRREERPAPSKGS